MPEQPAPGSEEQGQSHDQAATLHPSQPRSVQVAPQNEERACHRCDWKIRGTPADLRKGWKCEFCGEWNPGG